MSAFEQYVHHGRTVSVRTTLKGMHRDHCLCWSCKKFRPGSSENCPIAAKLFAICVEHNLVTPVYECAVFQEQKA